VRKEFEVALPLEAGFADNIAFQDNRNAQGVPMVLTLTNCGEVAADNCTVKRICETKTELQLN